jgi:hypothetical protein
MAYFGWFRLLSVLLAAPCGADQVSRCGRWATRSRCATRSHHGSRWDR